MSVAVEPSPLPEAPRLLPDTNVYLDLADGKLSAREEQLLRLAAHQDPPLFWACEITFDELVGNIHSRKSARFETYRRALHWMERLCGGRGIAEDKSWALRRGVYTDAVPCDPARGLELVRVRRGIIQAKTFDRLPAGFLAKVEQLRARYRERIDDWVAGRTTIGHAARVEPQPGEAVVEGSEVAADVVLDVSRRHTRTDDAGWGAVRSDDDQKRAQRELIALEVSWLQRARNPQPYSHEAHRSDYNDYWLCAYLAAGYTLVTTDDRLRKAIREGGCADPRLVTLDEGLAIAEAWSARSSSAA